MPSEVKRSEAERVQLLRSVRGAPLSILVALLLAGRPLGKSDLAEWTAYGDNEAIAAGLRLLARLGAVVAIHSGRHARWSLTAAGLQLPLWQMTAEKPQSPSAGLVLPAPSIGVGVADSLCLPSNATAEKPQSDSPLEEEVGAAATVPADPLLRVGCVPPGGAASAEKPQSVLAALDACGIGEPGRSRIAALPVASADWVFRHVTAVEHVPGAGLGLAVHRMSAGWRAPRLQVPMCHKGNGVGCVRCEHYRREEWGE